jgi:hypothetical protein
MFPVNERRIIEGETFGFPLLGRWPRGSKRSPKGVRNSARYRRAWKVAYFGVMAVLLMLVLLAFVGVGVYAFGNG